jgi:type VI secretion system protein ImpH
MRREEASALARLARQPWRFGFDAAVRVLARGARQNDFTEVARFHTPSALAYPPNDVAEVRPNGAGKPNATVSVMGLTGPAGVLPRFFTELVTATRRDRSRAMHDFFDMLGHRLVGLFAHAGVKYRLGRAAETALLAPGSNLGTAPAPDPVSTALLSLGGYGTANLLPRLAAGPDPLLHYSGFYAMRPRSADRLAALASDWLGREVEVVQFAGAWLKLPSDQQTRLAVGRRPGAWNRLAVDAAIGSRAWDVQARVVLRIGPLDRAAFESLLPDREGLKRLVSLARAYLGFETGFAVNPVLAADQIPPLLLNAAAGSPPRLGWNTWVPGARPPVRRRDASEAVFEAEVVEAEEAAARKRMR